MADKFADDDITDFFSDFGAALRGEGTNVTDAIRNERRRTLHDYQMGARSARQTYKVGYYGSGRSFPTAPVMFDSIMGEEPTFTFGIVAREGVSSAYVGNATAYVLRYVTNHQGFFLGAQMAYYVDVRDEQNAAVDQPVKLTFNLCFEGVSVPISPADMPNVDQT